LKDERAEPLGDMLGVASAEWMRVELQRENTLGGGLGDAPSRAATTSTTSTSAAQPPQSTLNFFGFIFCFHIFGKFIIWCFSLPVFFLLFLTIF